MEKNPIVDAANRAAKAILIAFLVLAGLTGCWLALDYVASFGR